MTEQKEHITKKMFYDWQEGKLSDQEEVSFLQHIGDCTFCAEQFGSWMEEYLLMEPPSYLKEEIQARTRQLDIQTVIKVKQTSKQMKLMLYSLKVGLAVAVSIFLLTITTGVQRMNVQTTEREPVSTRQETKEREESLTDKLNRGSAYVTDILNQLSSGIFRIEFGGSQNERK